VNHDDEKGVELVPTPGGDQQGFAQTETPGGDLCGAAGNAGPANRGGTETVGLRDRLRAVLRRHIDPDDDTMPALDNGGFVWVPTDSVLDDLIKAVEQP
jgi:hypothetical protein